MPPLNLRPLLPLRRLATAASSPQPQYTVFNSRAKRLQRDRAGTFAEASRQTDYLKDEIARRVVERLDDIARPHPYTLDLHSGALHLARALSHSPTAASKITHLLCTDTSSALLHRDPTPPPPSPPLTRLVLPTTSSSPLPLATSSVDAVISSMSLHWTNDLPTLLSEAYRVLKPDAPFLAAMAGGDTLFELRTSLQLAEAERVGGMGVRVSPMVDVKDVAGLLQRAGFALVTVDVEDVVVGYPDLFSLMMDLGDMGEGNAGVGWTPVRREVLVAAEAVYRVLHGEEGGVLPATWRVVFMIGWKKGEGQQTPLERGSGVVSMKDVLEGKGGKK